MSDEVERRLEAARQAAVRQKETQEFVDSLTKDTELLKPIYNPEAWVIRDKAKSAATRGELVRTDCRHPIAYLQQFVDEDPSRKRDGKAVNLFECGVCHMCLWLVDPWGEAVGDA